MVSAAMPTTVKSLFLVSGCFSPTSSAAINTMANKKPPLPSFQERINVSGYTKSVNKIGETSIRVAAMLELMPNMVESSVPLEATLLSLDKLHAFLCGRGHKNVLRLYDCFCKPTGDQALRVFKKVRSTAVQDVRCRVIIDTPNAPTISLNEP